MDPSRISQVKHLFEVEHLSMRQISRLLHMCQKTVCRILAGREKKRRSSPPSPCVPFVRLIEEWHRQYPSLKAAQIQDRLEAYGYTGSYRSLCRFTERFRKKRSQAYHELEFLPGQTAQVDWMEATLPFGKVYGFVFILAYSRYLFLKFYPHASMEFFLDGHVEACQEIKGVARSNWYDNLKSVVIRRKPELTFNAQFLDMARHFGFSIHACNPGRGNEKGRVERVIRDLRSFVETNDFTDIMDLNRKGGAWRKERNGRVHRATGKAPLEALSEEPLLPLPALPYKPYRLVPASVSSTAFVSFETNRYSVPVDYAGHPATILAYPDHLEVLIGDRKVAHHPRSFARSQKLEHPTHREQLLERTPHAKYERILRLISHMGKEISAFLARAEAEGEDPYAIAYGLFKLLRGCSRETLLSAVREANSLQSYRLSYIESLLAPRGRHDVAVYPRNTSLLDIAYQKRELTEYDDAE
jgi:transposase